MHLVHTGMRESVSSLGRLSVKGLESSGNDPIFCFVKLCFLIIPKEDWGMDL